MTILTRSLLAAFALATAASAANAAQPVDQHALVDPQRQITDGYYPGYNVVPGSIRPATAAQRAEGQRGSDPSGSRPVHLHPVVTVTQHGIVTESAPQAGVAIKTEASAE
jgi:hypothetical protein